MIYYIILVVFPITIESLYESQCIVCWNGDLEGGFSGENTPEGGT